MSLDLRGLNILAMPVTTFLARGLEHMFSNIYKKRKVMFVRTFLNKGLKPLVLHGTFIYFLAKIGRK